MPYDSVSQVPVHVPDSKREQWMAIWNAVYERTGDEGEAFTQANAGIKATTTSQLIAVKVPPLPAWREWVSLLPDGAKLEPNPHISLFYLPDGGLDTLPARPQTSVIQYVFDQIEQWETQDGVAVVLRPSDPRNLKAIHGSILDMMPEGIAISEYHQTTDTYKPHLTLGYLDAPMVVEDDLPYPLTLNTEDLMLGLYVPDMLPVTEYALRNDPRLTQQEADYAVLPTEQTCKTCRWYLGDYRCQVVQGVIAEDGTSNQYQPLMLQLDGNGLVDQLLERGAVQPREVGRGIEGRIKSLFGQSEEPFKHHATGFKVLDNGRWIGWYTNAYEDREHEIFPLAEIERDVQFMTERGNYPELRFWHLDGTQHGRAEAVIVQGRFAIAVGSFDNTDFAKTMQDYYLDNDMRMSHGFIYDRQTKSGGTFGRFHTFEISTVPAGLEANPYTKFMEAPSMTNDIKSLTDFVEKVGDPQVAKAILEAANMETKSLDLAGVAHKASDMPTEDDEDMMKAMMDKFMSKMDSYMSKMADAYMAKMDEKLAKMGMTDEKVDIEIEQEDDDEEMDEEQKAIAELLPEMVQQAVAQALSAQQPQQPRGQSGLPRDTRHALLEDRKAYEMDDGQLPALSDNAGLDGFTDAFGLKAFVHGRNGGQ